MFNKILRMTWVEPRISGIESDRSTNWATTTSLEILLIEGTRVKVSFLKWAIPYLFFVIFRLFKQTSRHFYNKLIWKNVHPVYGAGIRTQPLEHESPPIITPTQKRFFFK